MTLSSKYISMKGTLLKPKDSIFATGILYQSVCLSPTDKNIKKKTENRNKKCYYRNEQNLQVFGIRVKQTKYCCCDCKKKLKARAKTSGWRKIPADQKRCRNCSARYRALLKRQKQTLVNISL